MLHIVRVDTEILSMPLDTPVQDAQYSIQRVDFVIVRIYTKDGITGLGYMRTPGCGTRVMKAVVDGEFAEAIIGEDAANPQVARQKLVELTHYYSPLGLASFGLAALECALWDAKGKAEGQPLYHLLGGRRVTLPVYISGGFLSDSLDQLLKWAEDGVAQGFHGVKVKVGLSDPNEDVQRIAALRRSLGDSVPIMVDANQGWNVAQALAVARRLEEFDITWLEEPVPADDFGGHSELATRQRIPIATGESLYSHQDFGILMERGGLDIAQPDIQRLGGVTGWIKAAALAEAWDIPVAPHSHPERHLQLAAAIPNPLVLEFLVPIDGYVGKLFSGVPEIVDGYMTPTDAPGFGLELRKEASRKYRVR